MSGRDFAFEALAEVTATDWNEGRGELNGALKSIKEQEPEVFDNFVLAGIIRERAALYANVMGEGILLTPSALAKHWLRVKEQAPKPTYTGPVLNPDGTRFVCGTCEGLKMVLVGTRPAPNPVETPEPEGYEEYAPCPECNTAADATFWRVDGSKFVGPDPYKTRELMSS